MLAIGRGLVGSSVGRYLSQTAVAAAGGSEEEVRPARVLTVLGAQWGDEGKGKLSDVLGSSYDVTARFNGGANAGHTVVDPSGRKVAFHLLPCGLMYPHTANLLGNGVVVDFDAIEEEGQGLAKAGITDWRKRLFISNRAHVLFGFHRHVDGRNEARLGSSSIGTTKKGIGPYDSPCLLSAFSFLFHEN